MNSLRYLASSLSHRSAPPTGDKHTQNGDASRDNGGAGKRAGEDEKAVARARRPAAAAAAASDGRRAPKSRGDVADEGAAAAAGRPGLVWRLLGLLLPFLVRERRQQEAAVAAVKARDRRRKQRQTSSTTLPPMPRMLIAVKRKTLVLDLDETLIHSMTRGNSSLGPSQMVEVHLKSTPVSSFYYVAKRPYCNDFLQAVLQWYDVAIFTASVKEYADPIIDLLERDLGVHRAFKRRFYRTDCTPDSSGSGGYIKDLSILGEDLARVMLVDNSAISYTYQQANGIPVEGWISDPSDRALLHLLPLLFALRHTIDVRSVLCLQNFGKLISPT